MKGLRHLNNPKVIKLTLRERREDVVNLHKAKTTMFLLKYLQPSKPTYREYSCNSYKSTGLFQFR